MMFSAYVKNHVAQYQFVTVNWLDVHPAEPVVGKKV
jgi:hypothetical protein